MVTVAIKMSLLFSSITCDRCNGTRLLGEPCPECGLKPRPNEVQPDLVRRRKLVADFKAASATFTNSTEACTGRGCDLDAAIDEFPRTITRLQRSLAGAAKGSRSADDLIATFRELAIVAGHWTARHPRPNTNRARSFGRSVTLLRQGFEVFAEALAAPNIHTAQAMERRGQELIDAGTAEIDQLHAIAASQQLLASPEGFGGIGLSARAVAGGDQPLELLDTRLQELAKRTPSDQAIGLGFTLNLFRHLLLVMLDMEESLDVARVAEDRMGDLTAICADPGWQRRHGVVTSLFSSAAFNLSRIDESNDLEAAAAALQLVMQCRDGVMRHCLATMLADGPADFHRLNEARAGDLIKKAAQTIEGLRLDQNLSQELRHAGAHSDFDVVGDEFVSHSSKGGEIRLSIDEFLDQVLGYLQTSVSLLIALTGAVATQGIELDISHHTPERDLIAAMSMLVGFCGYSDAAVHRDDNTLVVVARGDAAGFSTPAAGIATIPLSGVTNLEAKITDENGNTRIWQSELEPFREYQQRTPNGSEADELLALAKLMLTVRIDSEPLWTEDEWAVISMKVLSGMFGLPLREQVTLVRRTRELARAADQQEVASTLTTILQAIRNGTTASDRIPEIFKKPNSCTSTKGKDR